MQIAYNALLRDNKDLNISCPVLITHGGGLSWWNYQEVAELLQKRYHVILPILNGHAGNDKHFLSIEDNANDIIAFIDEHYEGTVLAIGELL